MGRARQGFWQGGACLNAAQNGQTGNCFMNSFPLLCFAGMPVCVYVQRCEVKARAEITPVCSHNFQTSTVWHVMRGKTPLLMFLEVFRTRVAT